MSRYPSTIVATLFWLVLASTSAFAALYSHWDTVTPISDVTGDANTGLDIDSIRWVKEGGTYYFRMDVNGYSPVSRATYGFYAANDRAMLDPQTIFTGKYKNDVVVLSKTFTSTNEPSGAHFSYTNPGTGRFFLEWSMEETSSLAPIFYVAGASYLSPGKNKQDATSPVAATPIPPTAWLLASGLLCLIGLRRKISRSGGL